MGVARTLGTALAPMLAGPLLGSMALLLLPFFLSGGLKVIYALFLFRGFRATAIPADASK